MSVFEIPCRTDLTHYSFSQVLDGVNYALAFRWNLRDECWYMDLRLEDGTNIANGVKIVISWPLLHTLRTANRPRGEFVAIDHSGSKSDPTIDTLGSRVKLYYFDATSRAEIASAL